MQEKIRRKIVKQLIQKDIESFQDLKEVIYDGINDVFKESLDWDKLPEWLNCKEPIEHIQSYDRCYFKEAVDDQFEFLRENDSSYEYECFAESLSELANSSNEDVNDLVSLAFDIWRDESDLDSE